VAALILSLIFGDAEIATFRPIIMPLGVIGVLVGYTLGVVIASRLYQWIGVRVKRARLR